MPVEPFRIERYFAAHEFTTPHLLGVSDCESRSVQDLLSLEPGAHEAFLALRLGYTESEGHPALRTAVASAMPGLTPDDVLVHGAGVEVLLTVALAVLEPGDHAVVHHPGYQAQATAAHIAGAEVSPWRAREEAGWAPDLDELRVLLERPRTRLLVLTTPHNPTGFHFDEATLRAVLRLAEDRGVVALVDEAYRGTEYDTAHRLPPAAALSPTAASLGLVSKGLGLAGLRIGWLATRNRSLREAVVRAKDYTSICAPAPAEFLATVALRHHETIFGETRRRLRTNLELLTAFMDRQSPRFRWVPPRAGPVTFPTLRADDPDGFARRAREQAGVLVVPGTVFDPASRGVRVGFGREAFPEGLERLEEWLAS